MGPTQNSNESETLCIEAPVFAFYLLETKRHGKHSNTYDTVAKVQHMRPAVLGPHGNCHLLFSKYLLHL